MGGVTQQPLPEEVRTVSERWLAEVDSRLPGLVTAAFLHGSIAWGEFHATSDLDFVAVCSRRPGPEDLAALADAHARVAATTTRHLDGFYCTADDLAALPREVGLLPMHFHGAFSAAGRADVSIVTWHELAEHPVVLRGEVPYVRTDLGALIAHTRDNLASYWGGQLRGIEALPAAEVGRDAEAVVWNVLGVARLHHLLVHRTLTSKSGAGRYVLAELDPRWRRVAADALAIREGGARERAYDDTQRGRDVRAFLAWAVADGIRRG